MKLRFILKKDKKVNKRKLARHWAKTFNECFKICKSHKSCNRCPFLIDSNTKSWCPLGVLDERIDDIIYEDGE